MYTMKRSLLILSLGLLLLPSQVKPISLPGENVVKKAAIYGPIALTLYTLYCYHFRKPEKDFQPKYSFTKDDVSSLNNFMNYLKQIGTPKQLISEMWYLFHDGVAGFGKQSSSFKFDPASKNLIAHKDKIEGHGLVYEANCRLKPLTKALNSAKNSKELIVGVIACLYLINELEGNNLSWNSIINICSSNLETMLVGIGLMTKKKTTQPQNS